MDENEYVTREEFRELKKTIEDFATQAENFSNTIGEYNLGFAKACNLITELVELVKTMGMTPKQKKSFNRITKKIQNVFNK